MVWKAGFLILIIVASGLFSYIKIQSVGDEGNDFNQGTRYQLGRSALLRSALSLHKDGDARADYLLGTSPITIEVVHARNSPLDEDALATFVEQVERYTGRSVRLSQGRSVASGELTAEEVQDVTDRYRRSLQSGSYLLIVYADGFESEGNEVGQTLEEFGMILSHERIAALTEGYERTTEKYISSTMLHEFGHQLGLGHIHESECVMNDYVESPRSGFASTPVEFCRAELQELEKIKDTFR